MKLVGHEPQKRQKLVLDSGEGATALAEYLAGVRADEPWERLGMRRPTIGGSDIDVRRLYELVARAGGSEAISSEKRWGAVAEQLGVNVAVAAGPALK
jgi:ARID/BRIGHT DNA binding domain